MQRQLSALRPKLKVWVRLRVKAKIEFILCYQLNLFVTVALFVKLTKIIRTPAA